MRHPYPCQYDDSIGNADPNADFCSCPRPLRVTALTQCVSTSSPLTGGRKSFRHRLIRNVTIGFIVGATVGFVVTRALASTTGYASYYGPGLYGHRTACGQTLTTGLLGVASRTLRCGSQLRICYSSRCITVPVVDRGPYVYSRDLDLTSATATYLCRCYGSWGVRMVSYG